MFFGTCPSAGLTVTPVDPSRMAKQLILEELPPAGFTPNLIERMFRKALRHKLWRALKPETRALILALRRWGRVVRSPTLRAILEEIYAEIELNTLKGRALLYGVAIALRNGILKLANTREAAKNLKKLICLGISYLSNPPLYRYFE